MAKSNESDRLAQEAAAALAASMTYGKWKGLQYEQTKIMEAKSGKKEIPDGWLICQYCGKPFKPKTKRKQLFCEAVCQMESQRQRDRERQRAYKKAWYAKQKEGTKD